MRDDIKKRIWLVVLVILILSVSLGIAHIINHAYFSGYENKIEPNTAFSASDSIGFYGSLLSFVGTITLGALALYQTKEANSLSKRLMSIEEARYKLESRPFFILSGWEANIKHSTNIIYDTSLLSVDIGSVNGVENFCLILSLTNTTQSYISVEYTKASFVNEDKVCLWHLLYANTYDSILKLMPGETKKIRFYGKESLFQEAFSTGDMRFAFALENRFGEKYTETFDASILKMPPANKGDLPFVIIRTYNYRIGKILTRDGEQKIEWEANEF